MHALTSQTEGAQAAVRQLDVRGGRQLVPQLHHHAQRVLAAEQNHLQVPAEQDACCEQSELLQGHKADSCAVLLSHLRVNTVQWSAGYRIKSTEFSSSLLGGLQEIC